jgi:hypothetical protein
MKNNDNNNEDSNFKYYIDYVNEIMDDELQDEENIEAYDDYEAICRDIDEMWGRKRR